MSQLRKMVMKVAIPLCRSRIAPLFDVARTFLLFEAEHAEGKESTFYVDPACPRETCRQLHEQGVEVLLCGALSRLWRRHLANLGIEVHHGLAGDVYAIRRAFLRDRLAGIESFAMPGCGAGGGRGGRRRRRHRVCDFDSFLKESGNVTF